MHSTLEEMVRKTHNLGKDWVAQIPFALFTLRQMPCHSIGYSPYEQLLGSNLHTPPTCVCMFEREKIMGGGDLSIDTQPKTVDIDSTSSDFRR